MSFLQSNHPDPVDGVGNLLSKWHKCGLWPLPNSTKLYYVYGSFITLVVVTYFQIAILINFVTITDVDALSEILFIAIPEFSILIKLICVFYTRNQIKELLEDMRKTLTVDSDLSSSDHEDEIKLITAGINRSIKLHKYLTITYLASSSSNVIGVLFASVNILPIPMWVPLDFKTNNTVFWIWWGYEALSMTAHSFILAGMDAIPSCMMCIIAGYYDALCLNLEKIGYQRNDTTSESLIEDRKMFRKCIIKILNLKRILRKIEEIFSSNLIVQFGSSGIVICMTVFQMSLISPMQQFGRFFFLITFLISMSAAIFLPCYFGNEILLKNAKILTSIYFSKWADFPVSFQKDIVLYMEGVKRHNVVRAAGVFDASLVTFSKIANFTYSLYALLTNLKEQQ